MNPVLRPRPASSPAFDGADRLQLEALRGRDDAPTIFRLLVNAEYWLSFEVARFEPLLAHAPSPLKELGVGVLLSFGESPVARLENGDIDAARRALEPIPSDLEGPLRAGLDILERAIVAREALADREREGFRPVRARAGMSPLSLRASSSAAIDVEGHPKTGRLEVPLGQPLRVSAADEKGRRLPPPEVESPLNAPVWLFDGVRGREVILIVPGPYTLQVPGRAAGRALFAR